MSRFIHLRTSMHDPRDQMDAPVEFTTMAELLAIPRVAYHSMLPNFHKFSLDEHFLMAEYNRGFKWWVVGGLEDATALDLPKWIPRYAAINERGERFEVNEREVRSTCGDEIRLHDGRVLRDATR